MNEIMPIDQAVSRYNAVIEFTKTVMKDGKDFGKIPGTDKPTLLKPGAEKLCSLFGLAPEFILADEIKDFEKGIFYFRYACRLSNQGQMIATGEGSANSKEKKYRWRTVYANKATEEEKRVGRLETKSGRNGSYQVYMLENSEPFDLINTLQKMAQKRALIAAVLIAANASEFFTQDLEEIDIADGEIVEEAPKKVKSATELPVESVQPGPMKNVKSNEIITDVEWKAFNVLCESAASQGLTLPKYERSKMTATSLNGATKYIQQELGKKAGK